MLLLGMLAVSASLPGTAQAEEGEFQWRHHTIRDDLVAVWVEYPVDRFEMTIPFVLYMKGVPGWLTADAGFEAGQGSTAVIFRSKEIEVRLSIDPAQDEARIAGYRMKVKDWDVLLLSGLGDPKRGPAVRGLSTLPKDLSPGGNPALKLYNDSADLRASIHYTP